MNTPPYIKRQAIRKRAHWFLFWAAVFLFVLGLVGTFVTANGGWENVLAGELSANWTIVAILVQALLTVSQWANYNRGLTYASRAVDAALNAYAYGSLIYVDLTNVFIGFGIEVWYALFIALYIICLGGLIIAWYPESYLVKD